MVLLSLSPSPAPGLPSSRTATSRAEFKTFTPQYLPLNDAKKEEDTRSRSMRQTVCRRTGPVAFVDVFGTPAPWWWCQWQHLPSTQDSQGDRDKPVELLTRAHLRQLGLSAEVLEKQAAEHNLVSTARTSRIADHAITHSPAFPRFPSPTDSAAARACLAHSRLRCEVSFTRGDARVAQDTAPFLSCRGVALGTDDYAALHAMEEATRQFHYELPFWLSLADLETQLRYHISPFRALSPSEVLALANGVFSDGARAVTLVDDRGRRDAFVNVAELWRQPPTPGEQAALFSAFRRFQPVNVATRRPFDPAIDDAIRADCSHSGCWCTIWGTEDDFLRCGAPPLLGALGIYVFDDMGDELFLTNALCCDDPLEAYTKIYPDRCIYCAF